MKRKVKKTLAFLLALTLMVSLMGKDRLFVAAETQSAETESSAEPQTVDEGRQQDDVVPIVQSAFEEQPAAGENLHSDDMDDFGSGQQGNVSWQTGAESTSTELATTESSSEETSTVESSSAEETLGIEKSEEETTTEETTEETITEETTEETEETETVTEEETKKEDGSYKDSEDESWEAEADGIKVRAYADKGVLPENAVMKASKLSEDSEEYKKARKLVEASGTEFNEMMALDIGFEAENEEGEVVEIEPDGTVRVTMELPEIIPANVEEDSLTINHIKENAEGELLEAVPVADKGNDTEGTIEVVDTASQDTQDVKAEFVTDGFSMFTITWLTAGTTALSVEDATVSVKDQIMTDGKIQALVKDSSGVEITEHLEYQWYVSENGNDWNVIEDSATVDSKEASYYVARDGARKYYKVVVTDETGNKIESEAFHVNYYDSLQNGSFENPVVSESDYQSYQNAHFIQIPNGTEGLEWKTSAKGSKWNSSAAEDYYIEIADGSNKTYGWATNNSKAVYNISSAAEGNQFAELNCQVSGALYQDILTQPGSTLYWTLQHAGRQGNDTMAVIISNTADLPGNWNPSENNYNERPEDVKAVITDGSGAWKYHSGTYVVPEGQYVTRFYFVAVSAAGGIADGNLLDDITFGKDVPEPPASKGFLTISKNVEGVDSSQIPTGNFVFTVNGGGKEFEVSLPSAAGEWSYTLLDLEPGTYTVEEDVAKADGLEGYKLSNTSYVVEKETHINGQTAEVDVAKKTTSQVSFTNTYEELTSDLVVKKKFNFGDMSEEQIISLKKKLTFTIKAEDGTEKIFKAEEMKDTEGMFIYTVEDLPAGVYEVAESRQDVENYTCDTTKTGFDVDTTDETKQTDKVTLIAGSDKEVTFTNTYTRIQYKVIVSKIVDGNLGNRDESKIFEFKYAVNGVEGEIFRLSHGGEKEIMVNAGDRLEVWETDCNANGTTAEGYTVTIVGTGITGTDNKAGKYIVDSVEKGGRIVFTNTLRVVTPPTGITTNMVPYLLMILMAFVATLWFELTRRRRN